MIPRLALAALLALTPALTFAQPRTLNVRDTGRTVHDRAPHVHDRGPHIHANNSTVRS